MRKSVQALLAGAMFAAGMVTVVPTASAAWDCPADALGCLYDGVHGNGDRYVIRYCNNGQPYDLPSGWWDKASSYTVNNVRSIEYFNWMGSTNPWPYPVGQGSRNSSDNFYGNDNVIDRILVNC